MTEDNDEYGDLLDDGHRFEVEAGGETHHLRTTYQNADHLYELESVPPSEYDYLQIDLRETPTLHGYAKSGAGYEETDIGEVESIEAT